MDIIHFQIFKNQVIWSKYAVYLNSTNPEFVEFF